MAGTRRSPTRTESAPSPALPVRRGLGLLARSGRAGVVLPEAELVPLGVLADREPAHAGNGQRLAGLAAERAHLRVTGVDVVDVEVHAGSPLVGRIGRVDRAARVLGEPRHVVLRRSRELLELPAEEPAPELARLRRVPRRDLHMHHLTSHSSLLSSLPAFIQYDERESTRSTTESALRLSRWPREGRPLRPAFSPSIYG